MTEEQKRREDRKDMICLAMAALLGVACLIASIGSKNQDEAFGMMVVGGGLLAITGIVCLGRGIAKQHKHEGKMGELYLAQIKQMKEEEEEQ